MTPQTKNLVAALLRLYMAGRPLNSSSGVEWDAIEAFPQAVFDELDAELKGEKPKKPVPKYIVVKNQSGEFSVMEEVSGVMYFKEDFELAKARAEKLNREITEIWTPV